MPVADSLIHVSIKAETLFSIGPLQVTNSMVGALLASAILLGASWWFLRGAALVPNRFQSGVELPIEWISGIVAGSTSRWRSYVDLISELSRLISLSMRLFGNVFAGEVLLATMLALTTAVVFVLPLAFFVPAVFLGLELLFGFVQAMVFALLTMAYITLAIAEDQGGQAHDESGAAAGPEGAPAPAHA